MPPRPRRKVLSSVEALRFAAGWRFEAGGPEPQRDEIRVDVIRPRDLVALSVTFRGCELVVGGARPPVVRPKAGTDGLMRVEYAFQHGFEEAVYEQSATPVHVPDGSGRPTVDTTPQDPPGTLVRAPVGFRPARASRLVHAVPAGEHVVFSTAGILDAMSRLPLVLHKLAQPGDAPTAGTLGDRPPWWQPPHGLLDPPVIHLGGGLVARLHPDGPVIARADRALLRDHPAPDPDSLAGALELRRNLERLRTEAALRSPAVAPRTRLPAGSPFQPGGPLVPPVIDIIRRLPQLSSPPTEDETAIEAPYRLVISPGPEARFAHATEPVASDDSAQHVELWHSRLANLPADPADPPDERNRRRRIVRALWARDRDWVGEAWKSKDDEGNPAVYPLSHADPRVPANHVDPPFLGSLDRFDRHMLVRQTSETWIGADGRVAPVPVAADELWLSSLGAWLSLHGAWNTKPYSKADAAGKSMQSILAWDHVAPMGRDQYVRVVYPGYLYPFGHQAALVKVTERKMKTPTGSVAGLYQRMFLVVGERSRTYTSRALPFQRVDVRPLVTPPIDKPGNARGDSQETFFWPLVGGARFAFTLDAVDHEGRPVRLHTPLVWVNEAFNAAADRTFLDQRYRDDADRAVDARGQSVAFVPHPADGPDTHLQTQQLFFLGQAGFGESIPRMSAARVVVPAVQQLSPTPPLAIRYFEEYVAHGFGAPTSGEVWAAVNLDDAAPPNAGDPVSALPTMAFGAGAGAGSDKAGGFLSPDLPMRALSRATGPVGDVASAVTGTFDPVDFLAGAVPKLFGLVPLDQLVRAALSGVQLPAVVTETLGRIDQLVKDGQRLLDLATEAQQQAQQLVDRAQQKSAELQQRAQQAVQAAQKLADDAAAFAPKLAALVAALPSLDQATIAPTVAPCFTALDTALDDADAAAALLPPQVRTELATVVSALRTLAGAQDILEALLDVTSLEQRFRFEWRPELQDWPAGTPILTLRGGPAGHLALVVEGRLKGDRPEVTASAEIRDFDLTLFGTDPLVRVPFDHLFFKAGSSGKPEIDAVLGDIEFLGVLAFVEVIKDLIPFDGFSDPPYLDVTTEKAVAGFTLELPDVALGVFNLSNMALAADVSVPFLGDTVTVGFAFCARERPFTLTVMCLGGGGWFLVRVAPDGLDVLELGLEATAALSVDFGVASGSISASVGIYIRLEGEQGSLTGYFRLRGEVDVLGLISASIELAMELVYEFDTGKMVGRATITVEVEVLFFSATVRISAERRLAGSNGDPSFREVLGAEDGTSPAWDHYCRAFAGA